MRSQIYRLILKKILAHAKSIEMSVVPAWKEGEDIRWAVYGMMPSVKSMFNCNCLDYFNQFNEMGVLIFNL